MAAVSVMTRRLALDDEVAALDERPERRRDPVSRDVLERYDLRDQLVVAPGGIRLGADDGGQRTLADRLRRQDLVEVAGADGRDAVDLEHGQEDVEDLVLRDPARGLDRDLLPGDARADRVVEPGDLARRLDDGLDVGVVEVEDDLAPGSGRWGDRVGRAPPGPSVPVPARGWAHRGHGGTVAPPSASGRGGVVGKATGRSAGAGVTGAVVTVTGALGRGGGVDPLAPGPAHPPRTAEPEDRDPAARQRLRDHSSSVGCSCVSVLGGGGSGIAGRGRPGGRMTRGRRRW